MRILLDECTPHIVKKRLPHLAISTVQEMNWAGIKNGALLGKAEASFDVLITTDKNLRYQQNLTGHKLAILQLPTNQVPIVETPIPDIESRLKQIQVGDFVLLAMPSTIPD
jgi:predicted nuclease of predicted toxin-antitoxin system